MVYHNHMISGLKIARFTLCLIEGACLLFAYVFKQFARYISKLERSLTL